MKGKTLLYVGSIVILLWGVSHIVPTPGIVAGFEPITDENRLLITMEWVAEGLTLCFVGALVLSVTLLAGPASPASVVAYRASAVMLLVMALWTGVTGARTSIIPIKLCPVVKTAVAILFIWASALASREYAKERATSAERNKAIVRRFYQVVNSGEVDGIEELVSDEYAETLGGEKRTVGVEGAQAHILGVRQTYPDLELTIERQIAEGEWVATCITARGTHLGSWMGIAPTGKRVTFTGVNVDRVVGGRIIEHGGAANLLAPLLEIGAVKVVGSRE
jgi:predicted ester cyclase